MVGGRRTDTHMNTNVSGVLLPALLAADRADACKFMACDQFSRCVVNGRTKEAQCLCEPGFLSVDGLPCQSVCVLQPDYCRGGECRIVPGHGALCR